MQSVDLIISAPWVLPIAPDDTPLTDHAVAIDQGHIVALLPIEVMAERFEANTTHHLPHHILMPGLVNAHTHTPMSLFAGMADDLALMDWLQSHIWPAEAAIITPESVAAGSELAIAHMIRSGTTCFNDHYLFPGATAEVVKQTGIRACLGLFVIDAPTPWAPDGRSGLAQGLALHDNSESHPRITWALAPHAPYTVSDDTLKALHAASTARQLPIHMHLHETAYEVEEALRSSGQRPIARLAELGLLSPQFIAVHMTQLNADDYRLIQDSGLSVVHCPESNLKLASGFCPTHTLLEKNINLAIATDGAASNNDLDLFGEIKTAALLAKGCAQDPTAMPAQTALKMATLHGARALGLDHLIGSIETGKAADLIAIDIDPITQYPIFNPASHLTYASGGEHVSHTWVAGRLLMENKTLCHIDTDALKARCAPFLQQAQAHQYPER